ncbi:arsenate reductase ArsC [Sinanaerobacter chloroacetimidivorans]|uniref:Arsenate reductase ArsC n=1 Tax=Sinanaerobacter chloroacetimidivorans TaxID=2818044 RepID=A0A8J8B2A8_9FIRM|nr:arsenate reductase ArsC [Sinanaerobacter chloroacetimidivorans]MBR0598571.1 arsenate reductase ArsC [Sinanaerobacter chloroacetimidivorans]
MIKVLFVCVHNSARSQMAEAFLNKQGQGDFLAESAGLEPAPLNELVAKAMSEIGYDISGNETNSVFDFYKEGRKYNMIVKVCDTESGQKCPIFPLTLRVLNWNLPDPSEFVGTDEEKLIQIRALRDKIKDLVVSLINEFKDLDTSAETRN